MLGESNALELGPMSTSLNGPAVADLDGPGGPGDPSGPKGQGNPEPRLPRSSRHSKRARIRRFQKAPWLIAGLAFVLYNLLAILRYERRETMSWDLGIFTQAVRQYSRFHAPIVDIRGYHLNLLGDHFHPIIATLAPFFALFPSPVTLLVGQSFLLAVAAVPITRTAVDRLGRKQGWSIGLAYALCWGLVQAANFDFHEVAFAVPLLAFSLCAYVRGETEKTVLWALPLLLVKEDLALLAPVIMAMAVAPRIFPRGAPRRRRSSGPAASPGRASWRSW